jgi:endonuclease G
MTGDRFGRGKVDVMRLFRSQLPAHVAALTIFGMQWAGCVGDSIDGRISRHTALGIPAPASQNDRNHYLSIKSGYVLSYNGGRKVPNWVSWELNASYLGDVTRQDDFRPDDMLPVDLPQAALSDYMGSGFDRGHLCPSGDRTLTPRANSETFLLSNVVPQAAHNNRGPWDKFEAECRNLAAAGKELYLVAGGIFGAHSSTIGSNVALPDQTFKVVVVLDAVDQGASAVNADTRVIAMVVPNRDSQVNFADDWRDFRVSVDTIETQTGDDFLSDVDPAVQEIVEARVDDL